MSASSDPVHPEFAVISSRLQSFVDWPRSKKQRPIELSTAGFFYKGTYDRVTCFCCGGGLSRWDDKDDPWEQHALWLSKCPFLILRKGEQFIEEVKEKYYSYKREEQKVDVDDVKLNDKTVCKICYLKEYDIVFIPCGHVACSGCSESMEKCPFCRKSIIDSVKIFFP